MDISRRLELLPETEEVLTKVWQELGKPGTWWFGAERLEIARQVREARACQLCRRRKEALSPYAMRDVHAPAKLLSAPVVDAVHRLTTDPGRLSRRWYDELLASGLRPEAIVEMIGIVAILCFADTLSVAMGHPERELPSAQSGEPTRETPDGLEEGHAWMPTVRPEKATGFVAQFYGFRARIAQQQGVIEEIPNIIRGLTAVPAIMQQYFSTALASFPMEGRAALSPAQVELASASTSAVNDCFY